MNIFITIKERAGITLVLIMLSILTKMAFALYVAILIHPLKNRKLYSRPPEKENQRFWVWGTAFGGYLSTL